MASALYTDIKKWKDGKAGSVFCRWVHVPAIPPAPASLRKVGPKFQIPITFFDVFHVLTVREPRRVIRAP